MSIYSSQIFHKFLLFSLGNYLYSSKKNSDSKLGILPRNPKLGGHVFRGKIPNFRKFSQTSLLVYLRAPLREAVIIQNR